MTNYTHIDMMAQFACNFPALDATERTRNPIQARLIRLPERLLTRACRLIADGQPASTPLLPATWTPSMAAMPKHRPFSRRWSAGAFGHIQPFVRSSRAIPNDR